MKGHFNLKKINQWFLSALSNKSELLNPESEMVLKHFQKLASLLRLNQRDTLGRLKDSSLHDVKSYSSAARGESGGTVAGQTVVTERRGCVVTVGINRPEVRNAVNQETGRRLLEELEAFDRDQDLNVAVLHGKGGNFFAGYDLKELANHTASLKLEQDVTKGPGPMGPSRLELSKPLIAAVSGFAVAGGLELALLADLRVVEESAVMGVFCRRFGVPLIDGGTVRLPHLIGLSRALDLILTGRPIGAQEALAYGLANRVVPDGQALQAAFQLAEEISSFPQQCLRADRSSAVYSCYVASSFVQAMQYETDHGVPVIQAESVAGATRFTAGEGRSGKFS